MAESRNTLSSTQYLRVIDLVSEGEIGGLVNGLASVFIDGVPLRSSNGDDNFSGFDIETTTGTPHQLPLKKFDYVEREVRVGVPLKKTAGLAATEIVTRTLTSQNVDVIRLNLSTGSLLKISKKGKTSGTSVKLRVEYSIDQGDWIPARISNSKYRSTSGYVGSQYIPSNIIGIPYSTSGYGGNENNQQVIDTSSSLPSFVNTVEITVTWNRDTRTETARVDTAINADYFRGTEAGNTYLNIPGHTTPVSNQNYFQDNIQEVAFPTFAGDNIEYDVQYKLSGQSNWITYKRDSLEETENSLNKTVTKNYVIDIPEGITDIRVVKVSGEGTVSFIRSVYGQNTNIINISGKTSSKVTLSYLFPVPPVYNTLNVRIIRDTPDSTETTLQNTIAWDSFTEIINNKLNYPNSSLVGVHIDSKLFSSIPSRGYEVFGVLCKIPREVTSSGFWNGKFKIGWTNNPAWILFDLISSNRYGLGKYIKVENLDKWGFYELSKYCDEKVPDGFGGEEKRYTLNAYIQNREEALTLLQNLCALFKGLLYWSNNTLAVVFDHPTDSVAAVNNSNVKSGLFSYSGTSLKTRNTALLVTWRDPKNLYKTKKEFVVLSEEELALRGLITKEINAIGVTSQGLAHRLGKSILVAEKYEKEVLSFITSIDLHGLIPGAIIEVYDKFRANVRFGGRIAEVIDSRTVKLDSEITIDANEEYLISMATPANLEVERADGTDIDINIPKKEIFTITNSAGTTDTITLDSDISNNPLTNAIWGISKVGEVEPQLFKVLTISESTDSSKEFSVSASQHLPSKYELIENDLDIRLLPISTADGLVPGATNIQVSEELYKDSTGIKNKLFIDWDVIGAFDSNIITYNVELKLDDGNFVLISNNLQTKSTEVLDVLPGVYIVRVTTNGFIAGTDKVVDSLPIEIFGKLIPPSDIEGFTLSTLKNNLLLNWSPIDDLDFHYYEIRKGINWESASIVATQLSGTSYIIENPDVGITAYFIKAIDTSGIESVVAAVVTTNFNYPSDVVNFTVVQSIDRLILNWDENNDIGLTGYEIREGSIWESSVFVGKINSNSYIIISGVSQIRTFLIKAIRYDTIYSLNASIASTKIAKLNKNILHEQVEDPDYSGFRINMEKDGNQLITNKDYGEYIFDVKLPQIYTAENIIDKILGSSEDIRDWTDTRTWMDVDEPWSIATSVDHVVEISESKELTWDDADTDWDNSYSAWDDIIWNDTDEIEHIWHFNNIEHAERISGTKDKDATYADCRFGKGIVIGPKYNDYTINDNNNNFYYTFWYKVTKEQFIILQNSDIKLFYSNDRFTFMNGQNLYTLNKEVKVDDILLIYVSANAIYIGDIRTQTITSIDINAMDVFTNIWL